MDYYHRKFHDFCCSQYRDVKKKRQGNWFLAVARSPILKISAWLTLIKVNLYFFVIKRLEQNNWFYIDDVLIAYYVMEYY